MNRGRSSREMRNANNTMETINAAATAILSAESRVPPQSIQKRRWTGCWSVYWCFGSQKTNKPYRHAVLVPEPPPETNLTNQTPSENPSHMLHSQPPPTRAPFVAPPSSPASFIPSESPSPAGSVGMTSMSTNMYSPGGPRSIFAIGPYANETQLVTPPVFSTYTTEPSTAPYTPPPESVHLTTPSSPEVPFAQLLDPIHRTSYVGPRYSSPHYDFQSYLLHPGSPMGTLISPGSAISGSGTSSPFPEYFYGAPQQTSGSVTPNQFVMDRQDSGIFPLPCFTNGNRNIDLEMDHRVSFELTSEDVVRCVEKKPTPLPRATKYTEDDEDTNIAGTSDGQRHQRQRAASLGSIKEFHFDHINEVDPDRPNVNSSWWANEKVVGRDEEACKNWSFFPVMQPGVS